MRRFQKRVNMSLMSIARYVLPAWLALGGSLAADAVVVKGKVTDARTREEIIGAAILVKEDPARGTVTGLDGSFSLETGHEACTLQCSYVGYKMVEVAVGRGTGEVSIRLQEQSGGGRAEQAERLLAPWLGETGFAFQGVAG